MQLAHIDFSKLSISALNMRHAKRAPDISDILPSIRARGVLVPLLVRPKDEPDHYEIVAGRRRYFSAKAVIAEGGEITALPCAIMEPGDDAAALEASLIENIARLDPDEMSQYETFTRLIKEGRTVEEIAATFGLSETQVKQRLALGNLLPKIRDAYRREEIDVQSVRHLTLATKTQQRDWLVLFQDETAYAPTGAELKQWLFGGQSISTKMALFPLDDYPSEIVTDLFGEDGYFADKTLFWERQNAAIAVKRQCLIDAGWKSVEILAQGERFHTWEHEHVSKRKGGKVFIEVTDRGEVRLYEGYLSRKEVAKRSRATARDDMTIPAKPSRAEITAPLQAYIDRHRHAAIRHALADHGQVALRLMLAHAITSADLWQVGREPQRSRHESIDASVAACAAQTGFKASQLEALRLLGFPEDRENVTGGGGDRFEPVAIFARLLALDDKLVLDILAVIMGETLAPGSPFVEALGQHLTVDMTAVWQPDEAFWERIRDRAVLNAMLSEIAGETVATTNITEKAKTQKAIMRDCLSGAHGRAKRADWLPRWMGFPAGSYTDRGAGRIAEDAPKVRELLSPN